jgi:hypothetical protein
MTRTVFVGATLATLAVVLVGSIVSARIARMQFGQNGVRVAMNAGATQSDATAGGTARTAGAHICFRPVSEPNAFYATRQCR